MNNEIKEILAYFEEYVKIADMHDSEPMLNWKDLKIVLDYITNLQEELEIMVNDDERSQETIIKLSKENERLKENAIHNDKVVDKARWNEMIYKSRNEKAIEYIQERKNLNWYADGVFVYELLNILEGSDKLTKYITNLQEENEILKKCNKESITFLNQDDIRDVLIQKDYKLFNLQQKIDKAIEYIKGWQSFPHTCGSTHNELRNLLNILRGEDND